MLGRGSALTWTTVVIACSTLGAATACGAFDVADSGGTPGGGGEALTEGGMPTGGEGGPAVDGGNDPTDADLDAPSLVSEDGGADAAIGPFDAKCYGDEVHETELNDTTALANPFTRAACGDVAASDTDWFIIDLQTTGPLNVGYNTTGDATLTVRRMGTGDSVQGASPGGGYRFITFPLLTAPGTYLFSFGSASGGSQAYRLVVTR